MNDFNQNQTTFIENLINEYPDRTVFRLVNLREMANKSGTSPKEMYQILNNSSKVKHGVYNLEATITQFRQKTNQMTSSNVIPMMSDEIYIPEQDEYFVSWGNFKDIETVVKSKVFYPVYITGMSGNGKTMMVEQACAKANRQYVRVQITPETDEDDLIGGFRLVNGETVFSKGPVIKAMEAGAVLLIDEIDRGSNKIMCLQGVLEGKPVLIKKTGEIVKPAKGFNILATANTKGKGSEDGRFIAATIIDEAFLERFTVTIEQTYPTPAIEKKIIIKHMEKFGCVDEAFAECLTIWSDTIRKTFNDGGLDEIISTRRLCHIVQSYSIFKEKNKAVALCVSRFDDDTKEAFIDLYSKVDVSADINNKRSEQDSLSAIDNIIEEVSQN